MNRERRPTMENALATLVEFGVPVASIIDIGVQGGTHPLIKMFPDRPHYLFEPVDVYFSAIATTYRQLPHKLFHVALSDKDGDAWQVGISRDGSGQVTHSHISDSEVSKKQEPRLVECKPVRKAKLDTILKSAIVPKPFLLKIDVDGHELQILHGSEMSLQHASVVIVEATTSTLLPRATFVVDKGFRLFDMVDLSYYYGILSQVDLVFVREDLIVANPELRPWETKTFDWNAWQPINEKYWTMGRGSGKG